MKTAISIPHAVFEEAERLARRLKTSRSELYARALAEFIGDHAPDRVTDRLSAVVDAVRPATDPFAEAASRRSFSHAEW